MQNDAHGSGPHNLSSAYSHLGDVELAKMYRTQQGTLRGERFDPEWFQSESKRRGWTAKTCSECDKRAVHENHDYICLLCRRGIC